MEAVSLPDSITNANNALFLCLCNKFNEAEALLRPLDKECMYHTVSLATIAYLQAILTYEQQYIDTAHDKVKDALNLCNRYRRKHTLNETFHTWLGRSYLSDFTNVELHAELCYAECLLERALLTFIQDENLISFIKGGLKIRNAYNMYRTCLGALEQTPDSISECSTRGDFETGIQLGVGTFNLLLSLLPTRVLKLLEWVGFSGDKDFGLTLLDKGCFAAGLRAPLCAVTLLCYHIVISPLLGIGDTDIEFTTHCLGKYTSMFPNSSLFLFFSGRLKQTQCLLDEALLEYDRAVSMSIDWAQIHHVCYWEMMWCYSFKGDWLNAAKYASLLAEESKWSKCSYKYLHASFLVMQQFELQLNGQTDKSEEYNETIHNLLDEVVQYKQRIAGKSIPFEKFAVARVEKYKATGRLILPGMEIIHIWNGFTMFHTHSHTLKHFLRLCDHALEELNRDHDNTSKHHHDNVCLSKLLRGICLRYLDRKDEAEVEFNEVATSPFARHSSKMDCYFPPFASAELGFMLKSAGDLDRARDVLNHTLKHYSKYGLESRLHFRLHSVITSLKKNNVVPTKDPELSTRNNECGTSNLSDDVVVINDCERSHVHINNSIQSNDEERNEPVFYTPPSTPLQSTDDDVYIIMISNV